MFCFLDLLVAPVLFENKKNKLVYLPPDNWVYLWNGTELSVSASDSGSGIMVEVEAEVGNPPVFYKRGTTWLKLFQKIQSCKFYYLLQEKIAFIYNLSNDTSTSYCLINSGCFFDKAKFFRYHLFL